MKKTFYSLCALLLLASACKKSDPGGGAAGTDNLLTDPATGWKRVAIIPFDGLGRGATPYNGMKGFDLQKADGKFAALYTQHSLEPNTHVAADYFFKAQVAENATASGVQEISFGFFSGGAHNSPFTYYGQFLPGSASPVFTGMDYTNNYIELRDKDGEVYAGAPSVNYPLFRYLADGAFIAGSVFVGGESFLWHYKNPPDPIGDFKSSYRPGIIDGKKRLFNIPIKAADGAYYEFSLCSKSNVLSFMNIRCREDRVYGGTPPNYELTDSGAVTSMPQSGFSADNVQLLTYDYNSTSGELTFVVKDYSSSADLADQLYCYRWKQGACTKLWQASLATDVQLNKALAVFVNKNRLNDWRLRPDGTLYLLGSIQVDAPKSNDAVLKLWEINASGIKVLSTLTYGQTMLQSFELSTCRYIDGAYYALAYPTGDDAYRIGDPHFHMEIVKLNP